MQNVRIHEPQTGGRRVIDKIVEVSLSSGDPLVKLRVPQPRDLECRVPRVTSDRSRHVPLGPNSSEKLLQSSIIADKYQLFEQVEGSSLYRCMDINSKEELVCKVSVLHFPRLDRLSHFSTFSFFQIFDHCLFILSILEFSFVHF